MAKNSTPPFRLPLFVNEKNKIISGAIMYSISYFTYYMTNHYPYFEPIYLPMNWVDRNVPFIPHSVWIYMSEYFYFVFIYLLLKKNNHINKYLYSFLSLQLFACLIFFFFPTTYPRENFPIPEGTAPWLAAAWEWLRKQDAPTNCFPSLHVASVYISAFVFWDEGQKQKFWIFMVWSTLIAATTLTTKQHYLADVIFGISLACFFFWLFHRKINYYHLDITERIKAKVTRQSR